MQQGGSAPGEVRKDKRKEAAKAQRRRHTVQARKHHHHHPRGLLNRSSKTTKKNEEGGGGGVGGQTGVPTTQDGDDDDGENNFSSSTSSDSDDVDQHEDNEHTWVVLNTLGSMANNCFVDLNQKGGGRRQGRNRASPCQHINETQYGGSARRRWKRNKISRRRKRTRDLVAATMRTRNVNETGSEDVPSSKDGYLSC